MYCCDAVITDNTCQQCQQSNIAGLHTADTFQRANTTTATAMKTWKTNGVLRNHKIQGHTAFISCLWSARFVAVNVKPRSSYSYQPVYTVDPECVSNYVSRRVTLRGLHLIGSRALSFNNHN